MEKASPGGAIDGRKGGSKARAQDADTPTKVEALAEVGIAKQDASRFEAIASIPPAAIE